MRVLVLFLSVVVTVWSQCTTQPNWPADLPSHNAWLGDSCGPVFQSLSTGGAADNNTVCKISCNQGFYQFGPATSTCKDGSFTVPNFTCAQVIWQDRTKFCNFSTADLNSLNSVGGSSPNLVVGTGPLYRCQVDGLQQGDCVNHFCAEVTTTTTTTTTTTSTPVTDPTTKAPDSTTPQPTDPTTSTSTTVKPTDPSTTAQPTDPTTTTSTTVKPTEPSTTTTTAQPTDPTTTTSTTAQPTDPTTTTSTAPPVQIINHGPDESCTPTTNGQYPTNLNIIYKCYPDGDKASVCIDQKCRKICGATGGISTVPCPTGEYCVMDVGAVSGRCMPATTTTTTTTSTSTTAKPTETTSTTARPTDGTTTTARPTDGTTTTAAPTTKAPTTVVPVGPGHSCVNSSTGANSSPTGVIYVCSVDGDNKSTCVNNVCVANNTTPTTTATVLINWSGKGGPCNDATAGVRYSCMQPYKCSSGICVEVATTTPAPTDSPAPVFGNPGDLCGVGRAPCLAGLNCSHDYCVVYTPPPPQPTINDVGGKCLGTSNAKCKDGLVCVLAAAGSTQNVTVVGGICAQPPAQNLTCKPGTQLVWKNGVQACVNCLYGTFSEHGEQCRRCPDRYYTPVNVAFTATTVLDNGPTHCTPCPSTFVADEACYPLPVCDNCLATDGKVCLYVDPPFPLLSAVRVVSCNLKVCPACTTDKVCVKGECKAIPTNLDATAQTIVSNNAATLNSVGVDVTTAAQNGVSSTLGATQDGRLVVLDPPTTGSGTPALITIPTTTQDNTIVLGNNVEVVTGQINVNNGASTVLQTDSKIFSSLVSVVGGSDGPTTAKYTAVGDGTAKLNFTQVNLDTNGVSFVGQIEANVGRVQGDKTTAFVQASGATLTGKIDVPVKIVPDADSNQPAVLRVKDRLQTGAISGGGDVQVTTGAKLVTNDTIEANVKVDGEVVFGKTKVVGTVDVSYNGVLRITPEKPASSTDKTTVPQLGDFTNCQGVIYFHIDGPCDVSRKGYLWTTTSNTNFACQIFIVGDHDCKVGPLPLTTSALGHARRLLGAPSSDSGCATGTGSSTVTNTDGTYQICGSKNSASSLPLSYLALFVTLLVTLCLRF